MCFRPVFLNHCAIGNWCADWKLQVCHFKRLKTTPLHHHPRAIHRDTFQWLIDSQGANVPIKTDENNPPKPPFHPCPTFWWPIGTVSQSKPGPFTTATLFHWIANAFTYQGWPVIHCSRVGVISAIRMSHTHIWNGLIYTHTHMYTHRHIHTYIHTYIHT